MQYATVDDLFTLLPSFSPPDEVDLDRRLQQASARVRNATRAAIYDALPNGNPRDDDLIDAFKEATCQQVYFWVENSLDPAKVEGGSTQQVASKAMGGRSVSYKDNSSVQLQAARVLCDDALSALTSAGLFSSQVRIY